MSAFHASTLASLRSTPHRVKDGEPQAVEIRDVYSREGEGMWVTIVANGRVSHVPLTALEEIPAGEAQLAAAD